MENRRVKGYTFEYVKNNTEDIHDEIGYYQCRGETCYDDEHDQVPEPGLWQAALTLAARLREEGFEAEPEHSEKGWVEVFVLSIPLNK
jgi:hypothetical protein